MSRALLYLPGRDQVYVRVLRQFCDTYGQGLPGLDAALLAGDSAAAQRLLHALRGACGAVGATGVQAEAQALELQLQLQLQLQDDGSAGLPAGALPDAQPVHASLAALVAAVRQRLAAAAPPVAAAAAGGQ